MGPIFGQLISGDKTFNIGTRPLSTCCIFFHRPCEKDVGKFAYEA
ncbi:hypothetical protein MNBD_ALPHA11-1766 [hydrothermal vent metagenome]|uniref:Uncharacterized protein n=1 Tax=hydrothermal vent metagenome TaxID=652676 RepID=A0A3B0UBM7_9ZZZZ